MANPKKPLPLPALLRDGLKVNTIQAMRDAVAENTAKQDALDAAAAAADKKEG